MVKKQWTCISCDKNVDKYNAKVGQHLNWDNLVSKKISPTKAGAFGQTGQLANKIRLLMENQKGNDAEWILFNKYIIKMIENIQILINSS